MLPDKSIACHRTFGGLKIRSCHDMVTKHNCQLWQHVLGTDKNTGVEMAKHMCLDVLDKALQIETQSTLREVAGEVSLRGREAREASQQSAQNMDALNSNLIRMHGQNTQLALMQVRAHAALPDPNQPELPLSIEHDQRH